jgi:membrane protein
MGDQPQGPLVQQPGTTCSTGPWRSRCSSYNKTYGSLTAVIIFLIWLWISNIAILLGAEFDAELQRSRAIQAGHSETDEPYVDLRDTRKLDRG